MVLKQQVQLPILSQKRVSLHVKREDLIHPLISGNKYRKLKYNLIAAKEQGFRTLLTFGGAFSNHIAATAYAGKLIGFNTIGVIRGDELSNEWQENPTLRLAHEQGMQLHFVSRDAYREKTNPSFIKKLSDQFGSFYVLPEGGTNRLAVKGCEEILTHEDIDFDVVCASVGTGGTLAGIVNASHHEQQVLGFSALKGDSCMPTKQVLKEDIRNFANKENWKLVTDYHFGGYAKVTEEFVRFINDFKRKTLIPLDPIYTGKMIFGILDLVKNDFFEPNTKLLAIHTGGLQGVAGMNIKLKRKNLPLLDI